MCSRPFETRSFAQLARCFPHSFAFYVAFPKTLHSLTRDVFHVADPISSIETQSLPSLLHYYPRSFTFYLGNPFPRLQGDDVATSSKNDSGVWGGVSYSRSVATGGSARVATRKRRGGAGADRIG